MGRAFTELVKDREHETLLVVGPGKLGLEVLRAANKGLGMCFGLNDAVKYYELDEESGTGKITRKNCEAEALLKVLKIFSGQSRGASNRFLEVFASVNIHDPEKRRKLIEHIMNKKNGNYDFIDYGVETVEFDDKRSGQHIFIEVIDEPSYGDDSVSLRTRVPGTF